MQEINKMEDNLLIAKLEDKIKFCKTRNIITNTNFLNLHEEVIINKFLAQEKIDKECEKRGY